MIPVNRVIALADESSFAGCVDSVGSRMTWLAGPCSRNCHSLIFRQRNGSAGLFAVHTRTMNVETRASFTHVFKLTFGLASAHVNAIVFCSGTLSE